MLASYIDESLKKIPGLKEGSLSAARAIHDAVLSGGTPAREVADLLHGTWLGHPLHPVLTDIPIGAWSLAVLFDGIAATADSDEAEWAADKLTLVGVLAAVPTAISGMADYSTIPKAAAPVALVHAALNSAALVLYILSLQARHSGNRGRGMLFSTVAFSLMVVSAWLGGEMVYKHRVGVNHSEPTSEPKEWTTVLAEEELHEGEPRRVEVAEQPVLLYRLRGIVYAIGAVCSHAGAPLEEGTFDGFCVECPWHQSVFDLRDGRNVHGPSAYAQPSYAARIRDGQIEVRLERA